MSNNDLLSSLANLRNWRSVSFGIVHLAFGAVIVASFFASGPYDWALHSAALLLFVGNLVMLAHYARVARDQWLESQSVFLASQDNRTQIEELFAMTDMLQAAEDHEDAGGVPVSASIGVATVPETASGTADVIPLADAALYAAKQAGKNRVVCAERRAGKEESQPRLVV